jgi:hypothetical protein
LDIFVKGSQKLVEYKSELMLIVSILIFMFSVKIYLSAKHVGGHVAHKVTESKTEMSSMGSSDQTTNDIASQFEQTFVKAEAESQQNTK